MNYCKIVNGEIVEGPRAITGKTQQEILNEGWLPHRLVQNYSTNTVYLSTSWEVTPTEVIETNVVRPMTDAEIANKQAEEERISKINFEAEKAEVNKLIAELRTLISTVSGGNS